jgi:hypothetical protein
MTLLTGAHARTVRHFIRNVFAYVLPLDITGTFDVEDLDPDDAVTMVIDSPLTEVQSFALACYLEAIYLVDHEAKPRMRTIQEHLLVRREHLTAIVPVMQRALRQSELRPRDLIENPPKVITDAIDQLVTQFFGYSFKKVRLRKLIPADIQHPLEKSGFQSVHSLPGLGAAVGALVDFAKRADEITIRADGLVVNERSQPSLYQYYREVARTLGIEYLPPLYMQGTGFQLRTLGADDPAITLPSMVTTFFDLPELSFLIGRQMGHIIAGHMKFRAGAQMAMGISDGVVSGTMCMLRGPIDLLMNNRFSTWLRASELTADRYGLLACQDVEACLRALMKLSGYPLRYAFEINTSALIEQAEAYQAQIASSTIDRQLAWLANFNRDNHYVVVRTAELLAWVRSGAHNAILKNHTIGDAP